MLEIYSIVLYLLSYTIIYLHSIIYGKKADITRGEAEVVDIYGQLYSTASGSPAGGQEGRPTQSSITTCDVRNIFLSIYLSFSGYIILNLIFLAFIYLFISCICLFLCIYPYIYICFTYIHFMYTCIFLQGVAFSSSTVGLFL